MKILQTKSRGWLILVALALLIALLAAGSIVVTSANASGPSSTGTPTVTARRSPGKGHGPHGPGPGRGPKAELTVTGISGQNITAKRQDGSSVTIVTSSSTVYTRLGKTVSESALSSGTRIHVRGTHNSNGSITATHVDIVLPGYHGIVTAVNSSSITIEGRNNTTHTIEVSSSTIFMNDQTHQKISLSNLSVGENIHAEGTLNSNGTLSAAIVHLGPKHPARPAAPSTAGTPATSATPGSSSTPISNASGS